MLHAVRWATNHARTRIFLGFVYSDYSFFFICIFEFSEEIMANLVRFHIASYGFLWDLMDTFGFVWVRIGPNVFP